MIVIETAERLHPSQVRVIHARLREVIAGDGELHSTLNQTSHHDTPGATGYLAIPNAHVDGGTADVYGLRKEPYNPSSLQRAGSLSPEISQ